jgi:hypothetical protein
MMDGRQEMGSDGRQEMKRRTVMGRQAGRQEMERRAVMAGRQTGRRWR